MNENSIYQEIAWKAFEMLEQNGLAFRFAPRYSKASRHERERSFMGDHYDQTRIMLVWLYGQLKKRKIVQDKSPFTFASKLQLFMPDMIEKRWQETEWKGVYSQEKVIQFNYPDFPYELDAFTLDLKKMARIADLKRVAQWKFKLPVYPTFALNKEEDDMDKTGEYWKIPEKAPSREASQEESDKDIGDAA